MNKFLALILILFFHQLGVFEMTESGLQAVSDPSNMFLTEQNSDSEILAGIAVAVIVDGSRAFVIEVQVLLCSKVLGGGGGAGELKRTN